MKAIGGTAYIKVNGHRYILGGSWSVFPTKKVKTGVAGLDGPAGYTEAPRIPYMEGTLIDNGSLSLSDLEAIKDATITLELVTGKTYVGREMYMAGEPGHDAATGEVSTVRFEGEAIDEM